MGQPVRRILTLKDNLRAAASAETGFWASIYPSLSRGTVIPILSNSLRNDWIFSGPPSAAGEPPLPPDGSGSSYLTVDSQLAELWADSIGYPLRDRYELARVAQFNLSRIRYPDQAKRDYLQFIKLALLSLAQQDGLPEEDLNELRSRQEEISFTDLARELEYPRFNPHQFDPLRLLARLPLTIYVTTSYYEFLEQALIAENKKPCVQVCFWSGEVFNIAPEHRPDPAFVPTVANPLVYHLHGLEAYPRTMVLCEDDYLDFLTAVARDTDQERPVLPLYLRSALKESSLILLGYRLEDWDFRTLLRGVIKPWETSLRLPSLAIQLSPEEQGEIANSKEAREYLMQYFKDRSFDVEWARPEVFINRLWDGWNHWRQGQP